MYVLISHAMGGGEGEKRWREKKGERVGRERGGEVGKKVEGSRKEEKEVRMKCEDGGSEGKERGEDFEEVREGSKHMLNAAPCILQAFANYMYLAYKKDNNELLLFILKQLAGDHLTFNRNRYGEDLDIVEVPKQEFVENVSWCKDHVLSMIMWGDAFLALISGMLQLLGLCPPACTCTCMYVGGCTLSTFLALILDHSPHPLPLTSSSTSSATHPIPIDSVCLGGCVFTGTVALIPHSLSRHLPGCRT